LLIISSALTHPSFELQITIKMVTFRLGEMRVFDPVENNDFWWCGKLGYGMLVSRLFTLLFAASHYVLTMEVE